MKSTPTIATQIGRFNNKGLIAIRSVSYNFEGCHGNFRYDKSNRNITTSARDSDHRVVSVIENQRRG
jgi:hypothetical protein